MSFQIPDSASLDRCIEFTTAVIASLESGEETTALSKPWRAMRTRLIEERGQREQACWSLLGASARVHVRDALWDDLLTLISGHAYLAAGKDSSAEPYKSTFGTIKARDLTSLGPHKATVFSSAFIKKARELNHPEINKFLDKFEAVTADLKNAFVERLKCKEALAVFGVRQSKIVDELEAMIAQTEIEVLTQFPGSRRMVRAMVSWGTHMGRSSSRRLNADAQEYDAYSSAGDLEVLPD